MKQSIWLWVLPWVVLDSTWPVGGCNNFALPDCKKYHIYYPVYKGDRLTDFYFYNKGEADDFVKAMNDAHRKKFNPLIPFPPTK